MFGNTKNERAEMKHLGDITEINGAEIWPVDVVTAGSPCQDLSVAGKRAGLEGERSGLFMEQMRIIKEMREHDRANGRTDEYVRPRYLIWENVPGARSSNSGEDFRCVLEEIAKVIQEDANIPGYDKWPPCGSILVNGGSIAWREHDAQYFGVPQRRKRICVLADFNGYTAPWILFDAEYRRASEMCEPNEVVGNPTGRDSREVQPVGKSLPWDSDQGKQTGEETPGDTSEST